MKKNPETKLSLLQPGEFFKFIPGQTAKYYQGRHTPVLVDFETNDHMMFFVLKKNEKSIVCRSGSVEYKFQFDGTTTDSGTAKNTKKNMDSYTGVDCSTIII